MLMRRQMRCSRFGISAVATLRLVRQGLPIAGLTHGDLAYARLHDRQMTNGTETEAAAIRRGRERDSVEFDGRPFAICKSSEEQKKYRRTIDN